MIPDRKRSHREVRMTLQVGETSKRVNVIETHSGDVTVQTVIETHSDDITVQTVIVTHSHDITV